MTPKGIEEASLTLLWSQIATNPIFIFWVIISILQLVFLWKEAGCYTTTIKFFALFYINVYLIGLYFFLF